MPKFCIDCRWFDWPTVATGDDALMEVTGQCTHPQAATTNLVTGGTLRRPASAMRADTAPCGPAGYLWEGKGDKP